MKKISWNGIEIEVTRRCQLKCAHCIRGDAQNIDISNETIDILLDNTAMFGEVLFTGGEPTLNIEGMRYFLEQLKQRKIPLIYLNIVTNGYEASEQFVEIVKEYYQYMFSQGADYDEKELFIRIGISQDRYHTDNAKNFAWYQEQLKGIAEVTAKTTGNVPYKMGRARALKEALYTPKPVTHKIAVMEKGKIPNCECREEHELLYDEQVIVMCYVLLTAKGELLETVFNEYDEYSDNDMICKLSKDSMIYEQLSSFNEGISGACNYLCGESVNKYESFAKMFLGLQRYADVTKMDTGKAFKDFLKGYGLLNGET